MKDITFQNDLIIQALEKLTQQLNIKISQVELLSWELTRKQYGEFLQFIATAASIPTVYSLASMLHSFTLENNNLPPTTLAEKNFSKSSLEERTVHLLAALQDDGIAKEKINRILAAHEKK